MAINEPASTSTILGTPPTPGYTEVPLEEVLDQADPFEAHGVARIKVQRGTVTQAIAIRVRSIPQDLINRLNEQGPKPPSKQVRDPQTRQVALMPDFSDPKYQEALRVHQERTSAVIVGHGLVLDKPLLLEGVEARTPEEKVEVLRRKGLTAMHFVEIATTILNLTSWTEEERERFFR